MLNLLGENLTHYTVDRRAIHAYRVDQCENCGGDVLPANHPLSITDRSEEWFVHHGVERRETVPAQGYYSDDTPSNEECDDCAGGPGGF